MSDVSDERDPGAVHRETAAGWDVVAREKYRAEFDEHVAHLRAGGDNLLPEERALLGGLVAGARVIQLQCSHGFDALGLLNAGATSVVGVDLSAEMVAQARSKAAAVGASRARFVVGDAADPPAELDGTADLVYTGRGSLPWLMALDAWGRGVARLLRPGGAVAIYEGHPLANLWDRESPRLALRPDVGYFDDRPGEAPGFPKTVAERGAGPDAPRMPERHWRPGQVVEALVSAGLEVRAFREYPTPFWDQFPHWPPSLRGRLPSAYGIVARRPGPSRASAGSNTDLEARLARADVDAAGPERSSGDAGPDCARRLRAAVESSVPGLLALGEHAASRVPAPGKWTPKQVIGHLVDSASNNHQRFVRAQFVDHLDFPGYDQDAWVAAQRYDEASWPELVALWRSFNLHLARVMEAVPDPVRLRPRARHALDRIAWRTVPASDPTTLDYFMDDYVGHLEHHLRQVLEDSDADSAPP